MTDSRLTDIALTTLDGKPTTLAEFAGGEVVRRLRARTEPDAPEVVEAIEAVLPR
jgi:hypothetical protein